MKRQSIVVLAVSVVFACGSKATTTYHNEVDFLTDAAPLQMEMESFEQLPVDNASCVVEHPSMPCIHPVLEVPHCTLVAESETLSVADLARVAGMHATHGSQYVIHYYGTHQTFTHQLDFDFDFEINAFGVNIVDWGDADIGTLTMTTSAGDSFTIASGSQPNDNEIFFGVISATAFNRVTLTHDNIGDSYSIDEMYYNIPEVERVQATVDLVPNLFKIRVDPNRQAEQPEDEFITAYMKLSTEVNVADVNIDTVVLSLNDITLSTAESPNLADSVLAVLFPLDLNSVSVIVGAEATEVEVDKDERVEVWLSAAPERTVDLAELVVTGSLANGGSFTGTDAVRTVLLEYEEEDSQATADINADGAVDFRDFAIFAAQWLRSE
jgi:hypothetical protein